MSTLGNIDYLHVKLSGGATAQCLGLMNAIYASKKLKTKFKISYYPYSTGTYWPFAIRDLLEENEILDASKPTKGLEVSDGIRIGKIITTHPLMRKGLSYEGILSIIRKLKLESILQFSRRELAILNSPARLISINNYYTAMSGGFVAINEKNVKEEMHRRFIKANIKSPFIKNNNKKKLIIIHYRLGDKRATGNHPSDFNADLVIDPQSYVDVLNKFIGSSSENIYVVSDEPELARELLASVNITAKIKSFSGDIWEDIHFMSQADFFIGSRSQVSQFANICVENNGGKSFMFNINNHSRLQNFKKTMYLKSTFLEYGHNIYSLDFTLEPNAHSAYKKLRKK